MGGNLIYQPPSGWEQSILNVFLFLSIFGGTTIRIHGSVGCWFVNCGLYLGRCDEDNRASQRNHTTTYYKKSKSPSPSD